MPVAAGKPRRDPLKSPDPLTPPAIHPNYLATELDRQTLVAGLRLCRRIAAQPALRRFIAGEYLPGEQVQSDAELLDYARGFGATIFHPVGTCKMGRDAMAVVDDRLHVHGLAGLRVADGSIMPTLVSGNTNAACIMIGEKCADLVRGTALARAANHGVQGATRPLPGPGQSPGLPLSRLRCSPPEPADGRWTTAKCPNLPAGLRPQSSRR